jgi:hypothetical protein
MTYFKEHFWCHVLRRPAERISHFFRITERLGESEIRKLKVSVQSDQNVLRLDIPIENTILVKVGHS